MPASTVTNGIGGAWEYRRGGYSLVLNGDVVRPRRLARLGARRSAGGRSTTPHLREVQREPVARLLSSTRSRRSI